MPTSIDLSIIIVNWNTRALLAQCLESVDSGQWAVSSEPPTALSSLSTEVIVVDNASADGSVQMVWKEFPWVTLIENRENVGFARANNQGIVVSRGAYILLLNSDTLVHSGALETLLVFMDAHPQAGACGPRLLNGDGTLQHGCHPMLTPEREFWRLLFLEKHWPRATYPLEKWPIDQPRRVEAIKGACLLLRRAALEQVGLLDESYFMYTEEVDLCQRLSLTGWELWYEPRAVVTHFGGASSSQMAEAMYLQLYRSKLQFYRKFGGDRRARRAKMLFALAYAPRWAVAAVAGLVRPTYRTQALRYWRLLAELPGI